MAGGDREKALDVALAQIEKQFGKGSVMRLGDETRAPLEVIPTGSIALDGVPRQRVARVGHRPLTNLHLGNRRGDAEAWLDAADRRVLATLVGQAALAFPRSRMIGFDLILRDGRGWLLEANAFGDLLPDSAFHRWWGPEGAPDVTEPRPARRAADARRGRSRHGRTAVQHGAGDRGGEREWAVAAMVGCPGPGSRLRRGGAGRGRLPQPVGADPSAGQ